MMKKLLSFVAIAAVAAITLFSCKKVDDTVALKSISVEPVTLTLAVGETGNLSVVYNPENAKTLPAASWSSSDEAVATVADGVVTAVAAGSATITAKAGSFTATCAVTVTEAAEDLDGAWSVIGKFNGWDGDVEMTKGSDGWYVAENVELTDVTSTSDGFKFRRDKGWDVNLGLDGAAAVIDLDKEVPLAKNGGNIALAKDAVYNLYLNPNAKLAKVVYVKDIEVEPVFNWDFTPGETYLAEGNLWKPVFDADAEYVYGMISGWEVKTLADISGLAKNQSTYAFTFAEATEGEWANCNFISPAEGNSIALSKNKTYNFSVTLGASAACPRAFFKITTCNSAKDSREGDWLWETTQVLDGTNAVVINQEFTPWEDCDNITLVMDFGGNPAGVTIFVKDITITEVPSTEPVYNWDFTPSEEYLSEDNLWKPIFDGNYDYAYGQINHYTEVSSIADVSAIYKEQSTYAWTFDQATEGEWGCCNFLSPLADHPVAMAAGHTYKLKVTVGASSAISKFIFSLHAYDSGSLSHEGTWLYDLWGALEADTPTEFSVNYTPSENIENISFTIIPQFGTPAGMVLYIKDIILIELGTGIPDYDPIDGFEF